MNMPAAVQRHIPDHGYRDRWIAIAQSNDVPPRHIFHGRLLGTELAVWRDDAGRINVWENRCPHRNVRLTIGSHRGDQLKCRYHGWSYATGTGRCVLIPAHPNETPPERIGVKTFPAMEHAGLIWTALGQPGGAPAALPQVAGGYDPLRSVVMQAPAARVADALVRTPFPIDGSDATNTKQEHRRLDPLTISVIGAGATIVWLVQPADLTKTIVHGIWCPDQRGNTNAATRTRQLHDALQALRDTLASGP